MAEFTTIFIPKDKSYVPSDKAIEEAVAFLDDVYRGDYLRYWRMVGLVSVETTFLNKESTRKWRLKSLTLCSNGTAQKRAAP